jgi:hypothetical protein
MKASNSGSMKSNNDAFSDLESGNSTPFLDRGMVDLLTKTKSE